MKRILLFTSILMICGIYFLSFFLLNQAAHSSWKITLPPLQNGFNSTKVIILAFDDSSKTEFTLAKPILDKYGYKGSFFTVCTYVNLGSAGKDKTRMTWKDINTLQQQGHDIESHTMTHTDLNSKSPQDLTYEIGGVKQCLLNHRINSTVFAYPASTGSRNATVVNAVSHYFDLARTGDAPLAFLHCNGYKKESNCTPFDKNGVIKFENRYDIVNWSDRPKSMGPKQLATPMNGTQMFNQFVQEVNLQSKYNKNGCIQAIPIVVYHNFLTDKNHVYQPNESFTDVSLFSGEMKYLHDNGFKVLKTSDLGYNPTAHYISINEPTNSLMKNC